jgi:hypothetical protein
MSRFVASLVLRASHPLLVDKIWLELARSSNHPRASGPKNLLKAAEKLCCVGIKRSFNFKVESWKLNFNKNKTQSNKVKCQIEYVSDTGNDDSWCRVKPMPILCVRSQAGPIGRVSLGTQHYGQQAQDHSMSLRSGVADSTIKTTFIFLVTNGNIWWLLCNIMWSRKWQNLQPQTLLWKVPKDPARIS